MFNKAKTFVKREDVRETAKAVATAIAIGVVTQIAVAGTLAAIDQIGSRVSENYEPKFYQPVEKES